MFEEPSRHQVPGELPERTIDGSVLGVLGLGLVLVLVMEVFLHPQKTHPNDSAAAFREYVASESFTSIHVGDFVGTMCIVLAFVALYRSVSHEGGWPTACATVGVVASVVVAAVFAVQMAVDGVALKAAVDDWVAEGIRDLEKGLSGSFQIANGVALLGLGLSLVVGRVHARWLGVVGALAGVGALVRTGRCLRRAAVCGGASTGPGLTARNVRFCPGRATSPRPRLLSPV